MDANSESYNYALLNVYLKYVCTHALPNALGNIFFIYVSVQVPFVTGSEKTFVASMYTFKILVYQK